MPAWLGITLAIAAPILSFVGTLMAVSFMMGGRISTIETVQSAHTKALEALPAALKAFVTKEEGRGYQAQLDRLERNDAECDGKLVAQRQEMADRMERLGARLSAHEQTQSTQNTALTTALARMESAMEGMREAINRMASERDRNPPSRHDGLLDDLERLVRIAPLIKQLGGAVQ